MIGKRVRGGPWPLKRIDTNTYTLTVNDRGLTLFFTLGGDVTVPAPADVPTDLPVLLVNGSLANLVITGGSWKFGADAVTTSVTLVPGASLVAGLNKQKGVWYGFKTTASISAPVGTPVGAPVSVPVSSPVSSTPVSSPVSSTPVSSPVGVPVSSPVSGK